MEGLFSALFAFRRLLFMGVTRKRRKGITGLFLLFCGIFGAGCLHFVVKIVNVPSFLYCDDRYDFELEVSPFEGELLHWEARYGVIDEKGHYRAPSFPCMEVVAVKGRRCQDAVTFAVRERPEPIVDSVIQEPAFQLLDLPELVATKAVDFRFFFQGGEVLVNCNGMTIFRGGSREGNLFTVTLPLTEGINWVTVVSGGQTLFSQVVFCDTRPPVVRIEKAHEVPEGIALEGWVEDEGDMYLAFRNVRGSSWYLLVPWEGEVVREWQDRAGNVTRETFSLAQDFRMEVRAPTLVQKGRVINLEIFCRYRDIPVDGVHVTFGQGGDDIFLEKGWGSIEYVFWETGEKMLSFQVASLTFQVPFVVWSKPVAGILVHPPCEVVKGEDFLVSGSLLSEDGDGCPGEEGLLEILNAQGEKIKAYSFITDVAGNFSLMVNLSDSGRYRLCFRSGEKSYQEEVSVLSCAPHRVQLVSPASPFSLVAGGEMTFTIKVLSQDGKGIGGVRVDWRWAREDGGEVDARKVIVPECSSTNGTVAAKFRLPTRVGNYTLQPLCPCWNLNTPSFRIQIEPANLERLIDLTSLPPVVHVNEEVIFTVKVEDLYGNPVGNQKIQIYAGKTEPLEKRMTVTTGMDGQARFGLSFGEVGTWKVEASVLFLKLFWTLPIEDG